MENICVELLEVKQDYLDKTVFEIERLAIHQFDRIGIVGKNGSGKTTLLKMIAGQIEPHHGQVKRWIDFAYFDQLAIENEHAADQKLLGQLAVPDHDVEALSGGEQTKLKIAQLFSDYYEGLLIDEPTTHLDIEGQDFLLQALEHYYGALLIVSHDRHLLDQVVDKIWEIEDGKITAYSGNYSDFLDQKALARTQQEMKHEQFMQEKARLMKAAEDKLEQAQKVTQASKRVKKGELKEKPNKMFMTKSKGTSQKNIQRAAKALEQRVEQLEVVEAPEETKTLHFIKPKSLQLHNKFPIMADELTLYAGEKLLLKKARFQFPLGRTLAITGGNGVGKTSLLKHIINRGEGLTISPKAVIGIYEQLAYQFEKDQTILQYMKAHSDDEEAFIRAVLSKMGFEGTDLDKSIQILSGGEAIRLVLCQLFLGRYNILILDEPTNFLDLFAIEALEDFIQNYPGTILLVSHDQRFIENVADDIFKIENCKLIQK